ncbi:START domain protein [Oesophagostomum dentatum]|uniref:START domain protein n=2 Tax=Oesophagostomum dentatum TaxID=61180 RepID=A0A0B1TK52_OESDE|nr:START domain protein [Oesophagostomum dentatum]
MKFTVEGVDYELSPSLEKEYGNAFKAACDAVSKTIEIIRSPGYKDRSSWKADCSNEHATVYYKDIDGLRYFAAKTKIPLPAQVLVDAHWNDIDNVKDYNDNIKFSRCLTKLTDNVDVANYASNEKFMVSSREFLVGRMRISFGNGYILAGRSCEIDGFKSSKNTVRAFAHVAAGWYYPDPEDPDSSIYDYLVSMDLKGMLVKTVANQALGKMVLADVENNRLHALKLSAQQDH